MALEGLVSGGQGTSANLWDFSIDKAARHGENEQVLVDELTEALNAGRKVKITYKQMVMTWPWRSGSHYLVQKVEPMTSVQK